MAAPPDTPVASYVGSRVDLDRIRRVLLVRLRSIGDTVLMTPCISALKAWRADLDVDVLLEPFCAPVLASHPGVRDVVVVDRTVSDRARVAARLRRARYDLAVNLSGGTTGALLAWLSGARWRVGFSGYRAPWLANCRVTSSHHVWKRTDVHTVEHQLALVAGVGIPVASAGPTSLAASPEASSRLDRKLKDLGLGSRRFAVLHVEASMEAKRWPEERFAAIARFIAERYGLRSAVIGLDRDLVERACLGTDSAALYALPLDETLALVERCALFVGNDSGPAHVAAAFARPAVVIFGPSNQELWRPWSRGPWRVVKGDAAGDVPVAEVERAVEDVWKESDCEQD